METVDRSAGPGSARANEPQLAVQMPAPGIAVVVLHGEFDLSVSAWLRETVGKLLDDRAVDVVVVDLALTQFIDSSILAELALADKRATAAEKRLRLRLDGASAIKRVLEISGLLSVLEWHPTLDEAIARGAS